MCNNKNSLKYNENDFHQLTKNINSLEKRRIKLLLKSQKKYKSKHCSLCLCSNGKYEYKTDDKTTKNLCKHCIKIVKKTITPVKNYSEKQCPVCLELDGFYIIDDITLSLCNDCYGGIKRLNI